MDNTRNRHTGTVKDPRAQKRLERLIAERGDRSKDAVIGRCIERGVLAEDPNDPAIVLKCIAATVARIETRLAPINDHVTTTRPNSVQPASLAIVSKAPPKPSMLDWLRTWPETKTGTAFGLAGCTLAAMASSYLAVLVANHM